MKRGKNLLFPAIVFLAVASLLPLIIISMRDKAAVLESSFADEALLSLSNFHYKELEGSGAEVLGQLGYHFESRDEIKQIKIVKKDSGYTASVSSEKAMKIGDETLLEGGVLYERSDGYRLVAEKSRYLQKSQMLFVDSNFSFSGDRFVAYGDSSQVDMGNRRVAISNVRAKINY